MKKTYLLIILFGLMLPIYAQSPYASIPLPNGTNLDKRTKTDLKVDAQNHLWLTFGSRKYNNTILTSTIGLAYYDGTTWTTWNKANSDLPTNALTSIALQGNIVWIGTQSGLVKKDGTNWTIFNKGNSSIVNDSVNDVSVVNNTVWIATQNGVSKFDGTNWTNYTKTSHAIADDKVNTILATNSGVWIGTDNGISALSGTTWTTFNKNNSGLKTDKIFTLEQTTDGTVWIGTDTAVVGPDLYGGVYTLKNNTILTAQGYTNYCGSREFQTPVFGIGIKGNHSIIPSALPGAGLASSIQLLELGINTTTPYQSQSRASYPYHGGIFTVVAANNIVYWCSRDGLSSGDSLYSIDLSAYQNATTGPVLSYLNINKVSTPILNRGDMFWDLQNGGYEVPKGSCKKAAFTSSLWIGGVSNQNLRMAAQTYRQNGNDYFPGPLQIGTATTNPATQQQFDRIWRVNRQTIEEFKVKYAAGKVTDGSYIVPENLMSWPAHGDSANDYAANLAPFVDANGDGRYNPMDGDYPKIKGDQMLFWIFNDKADIHTETQGVPLGVEVHASAYAYTCDAITDNDSNTALNYTTFYHYDIFNRSTETLDSVKYGIWTDVDLGNYNDDYIECNPEKNYAIGYNGDDDDDGITGYGQNPPAIGVAILDNQTELNKMSGFMYYNNDFSQTGNPTQPEHYWGYLNNRWRDGSPLTYGGNGKGGADTASFMFPGNHDLGGRPEWTERNSQNAPGDRRMLSNLSAITPMLPGNKHSLDYAIVFSRAQSGGATGSFTKLDTDIDKVRNWYANQSFPSCLDLTTGMNQTQPVSDKKVTIFPNPANQTIGLSMPGLSSNATYAIIDITGRIVLSGKVSTSIGVQDLQQGVYFVEVKDGGQQYVSKFIKN